MSKCLVQLLTVPRRYQRVRITVQQEQRRCLSAEAAGRCSDRRRHRAGGGDPRLPSHPRRRRRVRWVPLGGRTRGPGRVCPDRYIREPDGRWRCPLAQPDW